MGESKTHMDLVKLIHEFSISIVPENFHCFISLDSPITKKPKDVIENFIPDLYYSYNNLLIIGEAKTLNDFDTKHSKAQYDAYLKKCDLFEGKAVFVVAVPWELVSTAKNYFRLVKQKNNTFTKIVVIDEMGGKFIL